MMSGVVTGTVLIGLRFVCPQTSFALVQFTFFFVPLEFFYFFFLCIANNSQQCILCTETSIVTLLSRLDYYYYYYFLFLLGQEACKAPKLILKGAVSFAEWWCEASKQGMAAGLVSSLGSVALVWPGHRRIFQHKVFTWQALKNLSLTLAASGCQIIGFFPSLLFIAALFGASLPCLVTASANSGPIFLPTTTSGVVFCKCTSPYGICQRKNAKFLSLVT